MLESNARKRLNKTKLFLNINVLKSDTFTTN